MKTMQSIKSKLFISYTITIFIILLFLSLISMYFFNLNKDIRSIDLLDTTYGSIEDTILDNKSLNIKDIDKYIELKNQFLIIFKNEKLVFSNQSRYKTQEILEEIYYKDEDEDEKEKHHNRRDELNEKYERFYDDGFIEIDDYVLSVNYFEENKNEYEIYLGIDERYLEQSLDDVYSAIMVLNIIILIVLTLLGYLLINKTINPLKQILIELKVLQSNEDLSKRLKVVKTNDEFEQLTISFNKMLENIENSVENIKQFSSDASHELKTPLTVIQGEIELCKNKGLSKEELEKTLLKVDVEQKKLQEIIKNFLLLSRLDKEVLKNKKASLDKVLFEAIELNLEAIENKNLELQLDIQEELDVSFDEKYLYIVINNLLTNAIKYTNSGYINISTDKKANKIVLSVKDSGIGISNEDKNRIFERFYRVDKSRTTFKDGIGLGLSIVKKICDRFNSKIKVTSQIEKGTTFTIEFNI